MSTTAYDWRKVLEEIEVKDRVKPGDSANFLEMARSLARGSVWSIPYESLRTLGPPDSGAGATVSDYGRLLRPASSATIDRAAQKKLGITAIAPAAAIELRTRVSEGELQGVLRALYRHVLGNIYVMESQRPIELESQLRNGSISVREFVRRLAKSDLYKSAFFYTSSNNRLIELNFKHLLGRAPYDHGEIQTHFSLYHSSGYDAEIDSYIDSDEYQELFGENIVPYFRGFKYQTSQAAAAFPRLQKLWGGDAGSDTNRGREGQRTLVKTGDLLNSGQFSKPL